jgi:hypothetical protein
MKKLIILIVLGIFPLGQTALAQISEDEIQALRAQIETLTKRLDELERQSRAASPSSPQGNAIAGAAPTDAPAGPADEKIDRAVEAEVDEQMAALSWAERMRWNGDFRYRYENLQTEGEEDRNRSRIRARAGLEADVSPTVQVGFGLATGGDDPVSANQTLGGGGSKKDIGLDLAYFDWSGLADTHVVGGKFENFLVRPDKNGLLWDGDWRPEGTGIIWNNGGFFAQALGSWLEGDSRNGTEFAWFAQAGMNLSFGDRGKLMFGAGYNLLDLAGATPLYGDPDDFYGNSYVLDPLTGELEFAYDYRQVEAFAEYTFTLGGQSVILFADYVINTEADTNDTGYLFGARYGSARPAGISAGSTKARGRCGRGPADRLDFGGGTDARATPSRAPMRFDNWNFKLTYFLNEIDIASGSPRDFDRLMLDLNFKYK